MQKAGICQYRPLQSFYVMIDLANNLRYSLHDALIKW